MATKQQILEKAIQKAIDGGWKATMTIADNGHVNVDADGLHLAFYQDYEGTHNDIIFSHDFAKALWGEELTDIWIEDSDLCMGDQPLLGGLVGYPYNEGSGVSFKTPQWQYHLQQMVIAADPIIYLSNYLEI